jgi:hypothetical protein
VIGAMKGVVFAMLSTTKSGGEYYVFLIRSNVGMMKETRRVTVRSEFIPFSDRVINQC